MYKIMNSGLQSQELGQVDPSFWLVADMPFILCNSQRQPALCITYCKAVPSQPARRKIICNLSEDDLLFLGATYN